MNVHIYNCSDCNDFYIINVQVADYFIHRNDQWKVLLVDICNFSVVYSNHIYVSSITQYYTILQSNSRSHEMPKFYVFMQWIMFLSYFPVGIVQQVSCIKYWHWHWHHFHYFLGISWVYNVYYDILNNLRMQVWALSFCFHDAKAFTYFFWITVFIIIYMFVAGPIMRCKTCEK